MKKTVDPGTAKARAGEHEDRITCKVEITDGNLSIAGELGALQCGQINANFQHGNPEHNDKRYINLIKPEDIRFNPGWDKRKWLEFLDIWHTWHLNDMRSACEHQVGAAWNFQRELTVYHYRLKPEVDAIIKEAKERAFDYIKKSLSFTPTPEETKCANLADSITCGYGTLDEELSKYYTPNRPRYKDDHYNKPFERKTAGLTYQKEHSGGLLSKPCGVCGYEYGSAWNRVELPASVVKFLNELPEAS